MEKIRFGSKEKAKNKANLKQVESKDARREGRERKEENRRGDQEDGK